MKKGQDQNTLAESQTEAFDTEYVREEYFITICAALDSILNVDSPLRIADFGGGAGYFVDRLVSYYPNAFVYNIDLSETLIGRNKENPRKELVLGSFLDFEPHEKLDIVCLNWVIHHMVGDTLDETRDLQQRALAQAAACLKPGGLLLIFENIISGAISDQISSGLLFWGTSSR
ncbi:MAG: class I SAM-dependent methyltransferase, partial [Pseudomonadota bacterium]